MANPLPTNMNDIPPSEVRAQPLSKEELQDIRSLISVAKQGSATSSSSPTINQPALAGRRVMIPVTSKAFFEGELQPPTSSDDVGGEKIVVNNSGKLSEMTRSEACTIFDEKHQIFSAASKQKAQPKKSAIREGKISTSSKLLSTSTAQNSIAPSPAADNDMLPLMEIRETEDDSGNILNSEVVNMSSTIKRLEDNIVHEVDTEKDGKQLGNLLVRTLQAGEEDDITKDVHVSYTDEECEEGYVHINKEPILAKKPKNCFSEEAYKSIYSRLEELERLEEEDIKSKLDNVKSAKRLQSSGWSKGFLNKTSSKKSRGKSPATLKKENAGGELRVSFTGSSGIQDLQEETKKQLPLQKQSSEKMVAFSSVSFNTEDDEIQDAPQRRRRTVDGSDSTEKLVSFSSVSFDAEHSEIKDLPSDTDSEKLVSFSSAKPVDGSVSFCANEDSEIQNLPRPYDLESDKELRVSFSSVSFTTDDMNIDDELNDDDGDDEEEEEAIDAPTVSFSNNNEVKEIPRIGQNKVPPRPPSPRSGRKVTFPQVSDEFPFAPVETIPFDDNVFRGMVKERNDVEESNVKEESDVPKKKLSRFAQQRLEKERG